MKITKKLSFKKILLSVLAPLTLALAIAGGTLVGDAPAKALDSYPTTTSVKDPLFNYSDNTYNESALNELAQLILKDNSKTKTINDLISYIIGTVHTHGEAISNKELTVRLGRTHNSETDPYVDLIWLPVYMSTTNDGKNAVLTLYLATANGAYSTTEFSYYTYNGYYINDPQSSYPSNMYGTSFIRSSQSKLGNGGNYHRYKNDNTYASTYNEPKTTYEHFNKYVDFLEYTQKVNGVTETRRGLLYDDIVTPSQIAWQADESYAKEIGLSGYIVNGLGDGVNVENNSDWANYIWPNEAYGSSASLTGSFYMPNYFDYATKGKDGYTNWINDKVWLPSLTEVGTGNGDGLTDEGLNGLWKLTNNQRKNLKQLPVGQYANPVAWLRTANTAYHEGSNSYSTSHVFVVQEDGTIGTLKTDRTNQYVAIRPAIHLNLSSVVQKYDKPIDLPDTVTASYLGRAHRLDQTEVTLTEEQAPWFKKGDMNVRFSLTQDMEKIIFPVDAGEYWMEVRLDNSGLRFVNPDPEKPDRKVVKFVIEKKKIGIKWSYEGNLPVSVDFAPGTEFYQRDILAENIPKLGIRYNSTTISAVFYDFDKLLKDTYTARAYIIDEDKYKYNYVLSSEVGEGLDAKNSFDIGRKIISMPYIANAGEGVPDPLNGNIVTYQLTYRGVQYIQLENVSEYLLVSVAVKRNGILEDADGLIECLNPTEERTNKDGQKGMYPIVSEAGTLTYRVESVQLYVFTFGFPDKEKFTWPGDYNFQGVGQESGFVYDDDYLAVNIGRAKLDIDFVGLPTEWLSIQSQKFTIEVYGLYEKVDIPLDIMYLKDGSPLPVTLTPKDGVYDLTGLAPGTYTIYAYLPSSGEYEYLNNLYLFESGTKTQSFRVIQTVSEFNDNMVQWQYIHNGVTTNAGGFLDHDTVASALSFDYDGEYYTFSLTMSEDTLRDTYYVKAVYSGSKFVKDSGTHQVKVSIKAYYKNVQVDEKEYSLYFIINPKKYDLSNLEWDYDENNPPVYNGTRQKVMLKAEPLADLPGLTAEYLTEGNRIDVGDYKTTVIFLVSNEYARNYVIPSASDSSTYDGDFDFTCDWSIAKAKLTIEWSTVSSSGGMLFVPVLKNGGEFVEYYYQHKESNGTWADVTDLVAEGAPETYRVGVTLKLEYKNNYELDGETTCEFTVESGKRAVAVHFEANGEVVSNGDEFKYTGDAIELKLVVDFTEDLSVQTYNFAYYEIVGGNRTLLASAPFDIGSYVAVVTAKYSSGSYISDECASEVSFKIVKGDFDPNYIYWVYEHGDTTVKAKYDSEQEKWVDDNGKEVIFSFEYDGTAHTLSVESKQVFTRVEDKLTVSGLQGTYSATKAYEYTAAVNFEYDSARFNDPYDVFPRQLKWTITKKAIDYNNVRWGYLTKDGEERDFDFDVDEFRYTRDENGAVGYTVALIGLPKGVSSLMTYQTKNLTDMNSAASLGNTRAAVGEYLTSFTINGNWSDPEGNWEDFNSLNFPLFIPKTQVWTIKRRELSKLDYDKKWYVFDDRTHNILEACKVPYNELNYLKLEITFVSNLYTVDNDYAGYEGVTYSLYHAGHYDIRLYEMTTVYKNGNEVEDLVIWDTLSLDIDKAVLDVYWDDKGAYPVARAENVFATDMITTVYTLTNGAEVQINYVKSTNGDVTFYALAKVADAYKNDIDIKFADGQKDKYEFTYEQFTNAGGNAVGLDFPELEVDELEYTGEALTFVIRGWATIYQSYLYISAGSLTQTDQGKYTVVLRFNKGANAYWKHQTATSGEYNRDAYELKFEITAPKSWALDYPMLKEESQEWDYGNEIEFTITNWIALSKYVTYEVFYKGESLGKDIKLFFRHGGIYTIVFTIPEDSIGYWKEAKVDPRGEFKLQFKITGDPDEPITEITYPEFVNNTAEYTGSPIQFKVKNWDSEYSKYLEMSSNDNVSISGGTITATSVGVYTIIFKVKSNVDFTFADGKKEYSLTFTITAKKEPGVLTPITKPTMSVTQKNYAGGEWIEFSINGWASIYKDFLVISYNGDIKDVVIDNATGIIKVKNVGKYTLTISFKEGADAYWDGTDQSKAPTTLDFEVVDPSNPKPNPEPTPDDPTKVGQPAFSVDSKGYNGKDQTFDLTGITNSDAVTITGDDLTQKEVGKYKIVISLKDPENTTWDDGTTADIELTFEIVKGKLPEGTHVGVGNNGKPQLQDADGNPVPDFDFDFGDLFDVEFTDKDGNPVDYEDLVEGEEYNAKLVPNEDKIRESMEDADDIIKDAQERNEAGGWNIVYEPEDDGGGFNPLWFLIGLGSVYAVLLIIIVILARRRKRLYGDDDDDDYDDDDDDDEY